MRMRIPFGDKGQQALGEVIQIREVENTESFALEDAKPLLDLVHPRTVDRHKETNEAGVRLEPCLNLLPFMNASVVKHENNARHLGWSLLIEHSKQCDKFFLPFPQRCESCDLARLYSCSKRVGEPGRVGTVGASLGRGWRFVFSSRHSTISQSASVRL